MKNEEVTNTITPEQQKVLNDIYGFQKPLFSDEDRAELDDMFKSSYRFELLRKVFGMLNENEMALYDPHNPMDQMSQGIRTDFEDLGRETAIKEAVDDKLRIVLINFHKLLRNKAVSKKTEEFAEENRLKAEREVEDKEVSKTLGDKL